MAGFTAFWDGNFPRRGNTQDENSPAPHTNFDLSVSFLPKERSRSSICSLALQSRWTLGWLSPRSRYIRSSFIYHLRLHLAHHHHWSWLVRVLAWLQCSIKWTRSYSPSLCYVPSIGISERGNSTNLHCVCCHKILRPLQMEISLIYNHPYINPS